MLFSKYYKEYYERAGDEKTSHGAYTRQVLSIKGNQEPVRDTIFFPNHNIIVCTSPKGISVWNLSTGKRTEPRISGYSSKEFQIVKMNETTFLTAYFEGRLPWVGVVSCTFLFYSVADLKERLFQTNFHFEMSVLTATIISMIKYDDSHVLILTERNIGRNWESPTPSKMGLHIVSLTNKDVNRQINCDQECLYNSIKYSVKHTGCFYFNRSRKRFDRTSLRGKKRTEIERCSAIQMYDEIRREVIYNYIIDKNDMDDVVGRFFVFFHETRNEEYLVGISNASVMVYRSNQSVCLYKTVINNVFDYITSATKIQKGNDFFLVVGIGGKYRSDIRIFYLEEDCFDSQVDSSLTVVFSGRKVFKDFGKISVIKERKKTQGSVQLLVANETKGKLKILSLENLCKGLSVDSDLNERMMYLKDRYVPLDEEEDESGVFVEDLFCVKLRYRRMERIPKILF